MSESGESPWLFSYLQSHKRQFKGQMSCEKSCWFFARFPLFRELRFYDFTDNVICDEHWKKESLVIFEIIELNQWKLVFLTFSAWGIQKSWLFLKLTMSSLSYLTPKWQYVTYWIINSTQCVLYNTFYTRIQYSSKIPCKFYTCV